MKQGSPLKRDHRKEVLALRRALRWSQTVLAREVGVVTTAIAAWERGSRLPSKNDIWKLRRLVTVAQHLDVVRKEIMTKFPNSIWRDPNAQ